MDSKLTNTKPCLRCGVEQEFSAFAKNPASKTGLRGICRSCTSAYNKNNYYLNQNKIKQQVASYKEANRERINKEQALYQSKNKERFKTYRAENALRIRDKYKSTNLAKLNANPWLVSLRSQRRVVSFSLRFLVLKRDNNKCVMCEKQLEFNTSKCHHILPVSVAPNRVCDLSNLVTLCESCHLIAHAGNWRTYDKTWAEYAFSYTSNFASLMADNTSLSMV